MKVPVSELEDRMSRFRARMDRKNPDWEVAAILGKIHLYYFTGTLQDGVLLIPRNDDAVLWVRQSYERALDESLFPCIRKMRSYRDIGAVMGTLPKTMYLEMELVTMAQLQRLQHHLCFTDVQPLDDEVAFVRSVKSEYERSLMEQAGRIHRHVLEDLVPALLREGMDEVELNSEIYSLMVQEGHQGIIRFGMFSEMVLGQIGFGTSSLYPTCVNSPGGIYGMHPAVPQMGSRERRLRKGDLVVVDIGCGYKGYQTDKTMTYMFGRPLSDEAVQDHQQCVAIQDELASLLKPGTIPSELYTTIIEGLSPDFLENFMGFGQHQVKFLGHGIGLWIDEKPAIAQGFDEPLQEGMVFALEPKKGIRGVGQVGIENTFVVTSLGGRSITGENPGLISVY